MAEGEEALRLSLMDQLIDDAPESKVEAVPTANQVYQSVVDGLKRDLLELLNTRERCLSWPVQLTELEHSVLAYGIPDVTGAHLAAVSDRDKFLSSLGPIIRRCDPRFRTVKVVAGDMKESADRVLHFRIESVVQVEGGQEALAFDFKLEPTTRTFES